MVNLLPVQEEDLVRQHLNLARDQEDRIHHQVQVQVLEEVQEVLQGEVLLQEVVLLQGVVAVQEVVAVVAQEAVDQVEEDDLLLQVQSH